MLANQSGRKVLGIILGVALSAFLLWMLLLYLGWQFLRMSNVVLDFWTMTEALSTALAAATVLGGGILAYLQLTETSRSRHIAVADQLFGELNSSESIAARRWIFQHLPEDPKTNMDTLSDESRAAIKTVLNSLDRAAFLTQAGWISEEMFLPWMNLMVIKAWERLGPYVLYERQRRDEPDYYQQVEQLARRCIAWRQREYPDHKHRWVKAAI